MEDKLNKLKVKTNLKSTIHGFQKNWRLTQLMTLLEESQGMYFLSNKNTKKNQLFIKKSLRNQVSYKNTFITNPLIENKKISKEDNYRLASNLNLSKGVSYVRFPINANFVAQWLSENIVSSKTYKLSLLCDRVIKLANLKILKEKNVNIQNQLNLVGIKIVISGRILGAEIATSKTFKTGQIPNNTIKVLKDRGFALAKTRSGTIGIKVTYFWKIS